MPGILLPKRTAVAAVTLGSETLIKQGSPSHSAWSTSYSSSQNSSSITPYQSAMHRALAIPEIVNAIIGAAVESHRPIYLRINHLFFHEGVRIIWGQEDPTHVNITRSLVMAINFDVSRAQVYANFLKNIDFRQYERRGLDVSYHYEKLQSVDLMSLQALRFSETDKFWHRLALDPNTPRKILHYFTDTLRYLWLDPLPGIMDDDLLAALAISSPNITHLILRFTGNCTCESPFRIEERLTSSGLSRFLKQLQKLYWLQMTNISQKLWENMEVLQALAQHPHLHWLNIEETEIPPSWALEGRSLGCKQPFQSLEVLAFDELPTAIFEWLIPPGKRLACLTTSSHWPSQRRQTAYVPEPEGIYRPLLACLADRMPNLDQITLDFGKQDMKLTNDHTLINLFKQFKVLRHLDVIFRVGFSQEWAKPKTITDYTIGEICSVVGGSLKYLSIQCLLVETRAIGDVSSVGLTYKYLQYVAARCPKLEKLLIHHFIDWPVFVDMTPAIFFPCLDHVYYQPNMVNYLRDRGEWLEEDAAPDPNPEQPQELLGIGDSESQEIPMDEYGYPLDYGLGTWSDQRNFDRRQARKPGIPFNYLSVARKLKAIWPNVPRNQIGFRSPYSHITNAEAAFESIYTRVLSGEIK